MSEIYGRFSDKGKDISAVIDHSIKLGKGKRGLGCVMLISTMLAPGCAFATGYNDEYLQVTDGVSGTRTASASSTNSVALGAGSVAKNADTTIVGAGATGESSGATAMGAYAKASGLQASAFGTSAKATGYASMALGAGVASTGEYSIGLGTAAKATAANAIALGSWARAETANSIALGNYSTTSDAVNTAGVSIGGVNYGFAGSSAKGTVSFGNGSTKRQLTNVAAGQLTAASTDAVNGSQLHATNLALESVNALATRTDGELRNLSTQIKTGSAGVITQDATTRDISVAASKDGTLVNITGTDGSRTLAGVKAGAMTADSTEAVNGAQLLEVSGRVAGLDGRVQTLEGGLTNIVKGSGNESVAVGSNTIASASGSAAVGKEAKAVGVDASAVGHGAVASGSKSVALGAGSTAIADNSVALGAGSVAGRANSASVGAAGAERQITHVAAGTSATDAVNVAQMNKGLEEANALTGRVYNNLHRDIKDLDDKLSAGVAGAMAMAALPQPYSPGASMTSAGVGGYRGQSALAVGVSHISDNGRWVSKLQGNTNTQGEVGLSMGVGYQW